MHLQHVSLQIGTTDCSRYNSDLEDLVSKRWSASWKMMVQETQDMKLVMKKSLSIDEDEKVNY